jgi:hypothetical protein
MTKPIRPEDVPAAKRQVFPDEVFQAFNELIALRLTGGVATVRQDEVVTRIMELMNDENLKRQDIFDNGWLNVEEAYRAEGWSVYYDKPGYSETYAATFKFRKK